MPTSNLQLLTLTPNSLPSSQIASRTSSTSSTRCLYLLPAALASFAFITGFLFSFWCESIQFAPENSSSSSASVKMYGPWYQSDTVQTTTYVGGQERIFIRDVCVPFPAGTQIDSHLKAVRAFRYVLHYFVSIVCPFDIGGACLKKTGSN